MDLEELKEKSECFSDLQDDFQSCPIKNMVIIYGISKTRAKVKEEDVSEV